MYPAVPKTPLAPVMRHATEPTTSESLLPQVIADKGASWVARWTQVVLK